MLSAGTASATLSSAQPVATAVALYDYEAVQENQMSLRAGDRIAVYKREESGWWSGVKENGSAASGESGWFPASYVEEVAVGAEKLSASADKCIASVAQWPTSASKWSPSRTEKPGDTLNNRISICTPPPPLNDVSPPTPDVVEPAANASASADWEQYVTDDNQLYYVHRVTGESRWSIPDFSQLTLDDVDIASGASATPGLVVDSFDHDLLTTTTTYGHGRANSANGHTTSNSFYSDTGDTLMSATQMALIRGPPKTPTVNESFFHKSSAAKRTVSRTSGRQSARSASGGGGGDVPGVVVPPPPKMQAVEENGRFGYANNFWSDKGDQSGFDILVKKHRTGKEVCKDINALMIERARIEEIYAKSLLNLAKSTLAQQESGTAKTAWNQVKFDIENQGRARLRFVDKLTKEVQEPLMRFKDEQKKLRKNYEATIAADRRVLTSKYMEALKLQRVYFERVKMADQMYQVVMRGQLDHQTRKDFLKTEDNFRKEQKRAMSAGADYRCAVEEYEKARIHWEEDMTAACQEFQAAEEERIEYIKTILASYLAVQMEVNGSCKESTEMVESSISAVSKEVDIEMFVKSFFTGSQKPLPLIFEPVPNYI